jgi:hypothetical protein
MLNLTQHGCAAMIGVCLLGIPALAATGRDWPG